MFYLSMERASLMETLMYVYDNDLDRLLIFTSMTTSLLHSKLKHLHFLSLLTRLSVCQSQFSLLGILITFVHTFHFNLALIFVCFTFVSSVLNSINFKQLVLLYMQ
jgi:hypothetical protein